MGLLTSTNPRPERERGLRRRIRAGRVSLDRSTAPTGLAAGRSLRCAVSASASGRTSTGARVRLGPDQVGSGSHQMGRPPRASRERAIMPDRVLAASEGQGLPRGHTQSTPEPSLAVGPEIRCPDGRTVGRADGRAGGRSGGRADGWSGGRAVGPSGRRAVGRTEGRLTNQFRRHHPGRVRTLSPSRKDEGPVANGANARRPPGRCSATPRTKKRRVGLRAPRYRSGF